jgi:sialate O-acetylesterase
MKPTARKLAALLAGLILAGQCARADVKPNGLISDNMVLQQGMKVPIWGTADDGEKVTVKFQNQEAVTTAKGGKWLVHLENLSPGGPHELTIKGNNTIDVKNVLVGEVWIASGQSNMEMSVGGSADARQNIANSANSNIRLFTVPKVVSDKPLHDVKGKWSVCGPDSVGGFSAVAYFFGRDLQKARNVPVGLIHTSWGGTPAEAWTCKTALAAYPDLQHYVAKADKEFAPLDEAAKAKLEEARAKYREAAKKARDEGKQPPRPPQAPGANAHTPSALFNGMIEPLLPYAIKGAIWYQGESNAGRAAEYATLFPAMIKNWRSCWKQGDFPFLFVQLAPFYKINKEPTDTDWARLRESRFKTMMNVPNTAMAVITDVGEENDIHPKKKEPVGSRLALGALALAYGEKVEYSGPVYDSLKVEGNKAVLSFKHQGGGLVARGDKLEGFTICGEDKMFVNADARIDGDKIVVTSSKVEKPVAVRFGWANYPVVNLWNKDGLPASPFRTDDFAPARK